MNMKFLGLMGACACALWVVATVSGRLDTRVLAASANTNGTVQQSITTQVPNLSGQWVGTAAIFGL
jgi:hypothetical protein